MAIKNEKSIQGEIMNQKNSLTRKFDDFLYKKEDDYKRTRTYLTDVKTADRKITVLIKKLTASIVGGEKEISVLEYNYKIDDKKLRKLREVQQKIPQQIRQLTLEKNKKVREIDTLIKKDKVASEDLNKASDLLDGLNESIKLTGTTVDDLDKEVKDLKKKRKVLNSVDWGRNELFEQKDAVSIFLKMQNTKRKIEERKNRRERAKLDKLLNSRVKKDLFKRLIDNDDK